jgi:hypothetical protein
MIAGPARRERLAQTGPGAPEKELCTVVAIAQGLDHPLQDLERG